jgi:peroxiredoxin
MNASSSSSSTHAAPLAVMPEWQVSRWFNTPAPLRVADLRGRVVLIHAFQMLCPGCVSQAIPQALKVHRTFAAEQVAVIGLHTVFEHHAVMGPEALQVFIDEYRLPFPIGVDQPAARGGVPQTMGALQLRGTPSSLLLDAQGRVRLHHFGAIDDLALGALIGQSLDDVLQAPPNWAMNLSHKQL